MISSTSPALTHGRVPAGRRLPLRFSPRFPSSWQDPGSQHSRTRCCSHDCLQRSSMVQKIILLQEDVHASRHRGGYSTNWLADIATLELSRAFRTKAAKGLGKAGSRTQAQKIAARAYGADLLHMGGIQDNSLVAFTDGASNPNLGPCGAGAFIYVAP